MRARPRTVGPLRSMWAHRPAGRLLLGGWATLVLVLSCLSAASGASASGPAVPSAVSGLVWHRCGRFRCSRLAVPISYAQPAKGTLHLAVVELPATHGAKSAHSIVVNPGGPGESGVQFLKETAADFPAALRASFNLVSFDPRGVGGSDPVECATSAGLRQWLDLNPAPSTPTQITAVVAATKAFDQGCGSGVPRDVLASLSTAVTARDLDRLRQALGQPKLDYLGFSYGTYLGALYAQEFPGEVGSMVLDGAVDPALSTTAMDLQQARGFEGDLHDFFAWCTKDATCSSDLPGGARATYRQVMRSLKDGRSLTAAMTPALGGTQRIGYGVALTGVIASLYTTTDWPYLAQGLAAAKTGNGSVLAALAYEYVGFGPSGTASNLVSANLAVTCLDRPVPPLAQYHALAGEFARSAPDFGPAKAWSSLPCDFWPVPATGKPGAIHLSRSLPILVVGSTHDPATPYAWARALVHQLKGSELLTRDGDGHTGYFSSQCVQGWVDSYFATGSLPPRATVCRTTG